MSSIKDMTQNVSATTSGLAEEIREITAELKKESRLLTKEEWNNLTNNYERLEDLWVDLDTFLKRFHTFLQDNIGDVDFDTYLRAFEHLSEFSYTDPDLKGFLVSINNTKTSNIDLNNPETFKKFLLDGNSSLTLDENNRVICRHG